MSRHDLPSLVSPFSQSHLLKNYPSTYLSVFIKIITDLNHHRALSFPQLVRLKIFLK